MYPFAQSVTPAIRSHLDAQVAFLNDVSKSWTQSLRNVLELNLQLGQTLLEEGTIAGQKLLTADRPTDALSAAAGRAQPAADKFRAYQQHLSRVVADSQVELARVAEQHVQETSRTARGLADQVARTATEETENSIRTQQENLKNFRDPFQGSQQQHGQQQHGNGSGTLHASGSLQSAGNGNGAGAAAHVDVDSRGASVQGSAKAR
jgi:phasin family protein